MDYNPVPSNSELMRIGDISLSFPERGEFLTDIQFDILDAYGMSVGKGSVSGVTKKEVAKFKKNLVRDRDRDKDQQLIPSNFAISPYLPLIVPTPDYVSAKVKPIQEPPALTHLDSLGRALVILLSSGGTFSSSIGPSVHHFLTTMYHYLKREKVASPPLIQILSYLDNKNHWFVGNRRPDFRHEKVSKTATWVDIDMRLPEGRIDEAFAKELASRTLPGLIVGGEFFQLRGFRLNPDDPERVIRSKILVIFGSSSLITIHDGPIDEHEKNSKGGIIDSIELFRLYHIGKRRIPYRLHSLMTEEHTPGPGALFIDLVTIMLRANKNVIKRVEKRVDAASYDRFHVADTRKRVNINPTRLLDSLAYMARKLEEIFDADFIQLIDLCFDRERVRKGELGLRETTCGTFGDKNVTRDEIKARFASALEHAAQLVSHIRDVQRKVDLHVESLKDEQRRFRDKANFWIGSIAAFLAPTWASIELAGLSLFSGKEWWVLSGGTALGVALSVGFLTTTIIKRRKAKVTGVLE